MGDRYEFGRWLQQKRNDIGITQIEASRQFGFISKASVVGYENGLSPIPIKRLLDLSNIYQIPMPELLEKLKECDPKLSREFDKLAMMFSEYQISLMAERHPGAGLHKQNYQDIGGHRRKGFLNEDGYLELDQNIYYQTLIDLIEKALRGPPPEILFPGITDFAKFGPQIVTGPDNYAHQVLFRTSVLKRNNPCSITRSVKAVQIHQGEAYNHDGDKGHEGILHRENQHNGITRPALRHLLPDYQGPGKKLHTNPVDLDQGPGTTNGTIQGNLGEKPWTVLISKYFLKILIIIFFFSATANAEPRPWTGEEKVLFLWSCGATLADMGTTVGFLGNPDNWEISPILGRRPDPLAVITTLLITQAITVTIAHFLPDLKLPLIGKVDMRKQLLYTKASINTSNFCWNTRLKWRK